MHRTKSSVSLKNLALSLKQSINMDSRSNKKTFIPLRNSASTISLVNYNKQKHNNEQDYLIMMDTRKSKFIGADAANRESNFSSIGYGIKQSQKNLSRKQKLLQMTKKYSQFKLQNAEPIESDPYPTKNSSSCILNILQQEECKLRKRLQQNLSDYPLKNYNKYLNQVDKLTLQLQQIVKKQQQMIENEFQLKNRLYFLNEEIISTQMNFGEDLAQKQYCQQFLQKYRFSSQSQYKEQAKYVMQMIELQYATYNILDEQKKQTQITLQRLQKQFKQWKTEQNLQLKQKRFQNKFKEYRIQLMKIQQGLDQIVEQVIKKNKNENLSDHSFRKVRQYICTFFKKYNQLNINHISHGQIADGIDIFLCKQGLINQFSSFILQKTELICLTNGLFSLKLTQYCDSLKKIQTLFINQKNQINTVLNNKFQQKIIYLKQTIQSLSIRKQKNLRAIEQLKQNIQKNLAQQSLSMIQFLNKNQISQFRTNKIDGFFNINQIKYKVKQLKIQHIKRINRVKQIFNSLKCLQKRQGNSFQIQKYKQQMFKQEKQSLNKQIQIWSVKIKEIKQIRKGFQIKKNKQEKIIDQAIQKMKEKDKMQSTLKSIQKQIQRLRKQKIIEIQQNFQTKRQFIQLKNYKNTSSLTNQNSRFKLLQKSDNIWNQQFMKNNNSKYKIFEQKKLQPFHPKTHIQDKENQQTDLQDFQTTKKYLINALPAQQNYKIQRKTQSSPKALKQVTLANQNVFISRTNIINQSKSKGLSQKTLPSKSWIKKSASTFQLGNFNKQNQFIDEQLLLHSKRQSSKMSTKSKNKGKQLNNENIKNEQKIIKNTPRNHSNRSSATKLSLNRGPSQTKLKQIYQKPQLKSKNSIKLKNIDSLIQKKLLKR